MAEGIGILNDPEHLGAGDRLPHGGRLREAARRYGIPLDVWLDLSTGINPHVYPVPAIPVSAWARLPEDDDGLIDAARAYYEAPHVLPVAGSQAAIQALPGLRTPCRVGVITPGYAEHARNWVRLGHEVAAVPVADLSEAARQVDVLVVIHPNNPTGDCFAVETLLDWHACLVARGGWLVVDEAFMDPTPADSLAAYCARPGLIVLRSLGKFFGLAGARVGFVLGEAALLKRLAEALGPWPLAGPSRAVASDALADTLWQNAMRRELPEASARLAQLLTAHGLVPTGGCGLFQWVVTLEANAVHEALALQGVLTRLFPDPSSLRFGLPGTEQAWMRLEAALAVPCSGRQAGPYAWLSVQGGILAMMKTPTLMVQGTTSDAGKSLLVTGLCRVLARRGVRVAPFKPQNMALNSAVSVDGGEIGRAQAVQAQACGLAPHSDMNPVLLKPNTDVGAQVILQGRAIGNMDAGDYHDYKRIAHTAVLASYRRLCTQYSVILVEGAGSPAEINLRAQDIANMGFAEAVDCPVLLVADIDRGGVFAHLVGTLALLAETEQTRVAGFVINRFRGDLALLEPGLAWLERRTGKPVLGVLPYLHGLHLEAEDALCHNAAAPKGQLRVIVPVLPRISNHTDFDPLRLHPQVALRYVGPGESVPPCDLVILPGSKSVRADLAWLRAQAWEQAILRHLRYGGKLIGLCGGFQMLGLAIHDPLGLEGEPGSESPGLGLLAVTTTLERDKQLRNVTGMLALEDATVTGYEIHAGVTRGEALMCPAVYLDGGSDGALSEDGQILGTYLHGLFESTAACNALLRWAGLADPQTPDYHAVREAHIDRLADACETHLDLTAVARQLGIGSRLGRHLA